MSAYAYEKQIALEAVLQASFLARKMQETFEPRDVIHKIDQSPVTATDFTVQALINRHLAEHFKDDPIMAEEESSHLLLPEYQIVKEKVTENLRLNFPHLSEQDVLDAIDLNATGGTKERFWVLDPIDGTRGFIRNGQYAIALALIENGEIVLGVLSCPRITYKGTEGIIFVAVKNQGVAYRTLDDPQMHSFYMEKKPLPKKVIYCEPLFPSKSHSHDNAYKIAKLIDEKPQDNRLDSQAKYALVALDLATIYLRVPTDFSSHQKIWDHAAGTIMVEEAGGTVTDLLGAPLNFKKGKELGDNLGILVTNGIFHSQVVAAARQILFK